jgi:hypothetical protein
MLVLVMIAAACGGAAATATSAPTSIPPKPTTAPTAVATTAVATQPPATSAPSGGTAPNIPKSHAGRTECLVCHKTGANGAPVIPSKNPDHNAFSDANSASQCLGCHQLAK